MSEMNLQTALLPGHLRVSFFRKEHGVDNVGLQELFNIEPENIHIAGPNKDRTEMSSYGPGRLVLSNHLSRFDCVWEVEAFGVGDGVVATLGDLDAAARSILEPMLTYARGRAWTRVALGIVGFVPVSNLEEGYALIDDKLPELTLPVDSVSDFNYQINRYYKFSLDGVNDLRINRLSRWSVASLQAVTFDINLASVVSNNPLNPVKELRLMRVQVELDLNTDAEYSGSLTGSQLDAIFDEMLSKGNGVLIHGHHQ
jgi:hypothetical protein